MLFQVGFAQKALDEADSLKAQGLLMPAFIKYVPIMAQNPWTEISYEENYEVINKE